MVLGSHFIHNGEIHQFPKIVEILLINLFFSRLSVTAEFFDVTGHRVATLHRGMLSAGAHQFKVDAAKGMYLVKVVGQRINLSQKIMVK